MINFRLHVVMAERNILRIKELAEKSGLDANTVAGIYHNRYKRIDLTTLNKLCQVLNCTPAELFEYTAGQSLEPTKLRRVPPRVKKPTPAKQTLPSYHDRLLEALKKSVYEGDHRELLELDEESE